MNIPAPRSLPRVLDFDAIESGKIDILCGATTKTLGRSERVGFTQLTFVTGAASSVTIFIMICCAEAPTCGGLPVSISYSTEPSE